MCAYIHKADFDQPIFELAHSFPVFIARVIDRIILSSTEYNNTYSVYAIVLYTTNAKFLYALLKVKLLQK